MKSKRQPRKAILSALAATVGSLLVVVLPASPASAATTPVEMLCLTQAFGSTVDPGLAQITVDFQGPLTVPAGTPLNFSLDLLNVGSGLPFPLTNVTARGATAISAKQRGGVVTSSAAGVGSSATTALVAPYGVVPTGGGVPLSVPTAGLSEGDYLDVSLTNFTIEFLAADDGLTGATITCTPTQTAPVVASVFVVANTLAIGPDKCIAQDDGEPGSCAVRQVIEITITPGDLTQRHFVRQVTATNQNAVGPGSTVAAVNNAGTGVGQPTPNQNRGSQSIDLGGIQTPLVPKNVFGVMNDITVTDTRGGDLGWTLSATMTTITAGPGKSINANALAVSTTCDTATAANAWDFDALSKQIISGYVDPWAARLAPNNAPIPATTAGLFPVASPTAFTNDNATPAVKLCEKNLQKNNYGTTGGVFNVTGNLRLTVPAFQATGTYSGVMTVTLA